MENKKDFLEDLINMIENGDKENCNKIVEKTLSKYVREIQDFINDLGLSQHSAPFIAVALETVLGAIKQVTGIENDSFYKLLQKGFGCHVISVVTDKNSGEIDSINTFKINDKKSSDGDTDNHTSEDK